MPVQERPGRKNPVIRGVILRLPQTFPVGWDRVTC